MQPHSARVGNKLLSELMTINSNIKPQPVYSVDCRRMFHWQWRLTTVTVYWQWWCSTSTISVWWKLMSLIIYAFTFQVDRSLWNWSPGSLSTSRQSFLDKPLSILPRDRQCCSTWWLTKWLLLAQYFTVSDFITFVLASYACSPLVAQWYETRGIVDTRDTCAVSRYFFTATIYRGISWLWRYWYRHESIDDKYRGIAGIAQHYYPGSLAGIKAVIRIAIRLRRRK